MAEVFNRAYIEPEDYQINTWMTLYKVNTQLTGAMVFDFSVSNMKDNNVTIEIQLVNGENILHYILGPTELQGQGIAWDSSHKIVMMPNDELQVKASAEGVSFYASIVSGLKLPA